MRRVTREVLTGGVVFVVSLALVVGITVFLSGRLIRVSGESMRPTYSNGDLLVTDPLDHKSLGEVKRDDVVILGKPSGWTLNHEDSRPDIVKRVIAVGPETVELDGDGRLRRVGEDSERQLIDSREDDVDLPECKTGVSKTLEVPRGFVLVRGDNVNNSYDSRWAWCNGEDPLVPESSLSRVVRLHVPLNWRS